MRLWAGNFAFWQNLVAGLWKLLFYVYRRALWRQTFLEGVLIFHPSRILVIFSLLLKKRLVEGLSALQSTFTGERSGNVLVFKFFPTVWDLEWKRDWLLVEDFRQVCQSCILIFPTINLRKNLFRKMYDLYHHSRFVAINVLSHFQHGCQNVFLISPRNHSFWNILFETSFFTDGKRAKTLQTFQKCFDRITKTGFYAFEKKVFPLPRTTKKHLFGNWREFFSTCSWTFSSVFSKLRYRFEKRKTKFSKFVFSTCSQLAQNMFKFFGDESDTCLSELQSFLVLWVRNFFGLWKKLRHSCQSSILPVQKNMTDKRTHLDFFMLFSHFE